MRAREREGEREVVRLRERVKEIERVRKEAREEESLATPAGVRGVGAERIKRAEKRSTADSSSAQKLTEARGC